MAMVVMRVNVLPVPARWEKDLGSQERAGLLGKMFRFIGRSVLPYAHVGYCLLGWIGLIICSDAC